MCQAAILYCKTDMIGFVCTAHCKSDMFVMLRCFLHEWWSGVVAWMWLAFSLFDWFDYCLLLERFIGKLHCALILIKYNKRYICFIFSVVVKPNECHSIKPKINVVVKPNEKFITAAVKPNECRSIKLHLFFPRNSIGRRYISLGFSGQLIEVRGLFVTHQSLCWTC